MNTALPTLDYSGNITSTRTLNIQSLGSWSPCGVTIDHYEHLWVHDDLQNPIVHVVQGVYTKYTGTSYSVNPAAQSQDVAQLIKVAVRACTAGDEYCSDYAVSSNWAALGGYPNKAVNFPCFQQEIYNPTDDPNDQIRKNIVQNLANAGVRQVRVVAPWYKLETSLGVYSSTEFQHRDDCVHYIATNASATPLMNVMVQVIDTPDWAEDGRAGQNCLINFPTDKKYPPCDCLPPTASCADFAGFMTKLTTNLLHTYSTQGGTGGGLLPSRLSYEIWSEPNNLRKFWPLCPYLNGGLQACATDDTSHGPAQYLALLSAAYSAVKAQALGGVTVVTGAPLSGWALGDSPLNIPDWVSAIYGDWCGPPSSTCRSANPPPWDVVGAHPYPKLDTPGNPSPRDCPQLDGPDAFKRSGTDILGVFSDMSSYGDAALPIWFTEYAWAADGDWGTHHVEGYCNSNDSSDTMSQANRLFYSLRFSNNNGVPNTVRHMVWFTGDRLLLDNSGTSCDNNGDPMDYDIYTCGTSILDLNLNPLTNVYNALVSAPQ